jgi:hypothetical protein
MRRYTRYLVRIVMSRQSGILRIFRPTPGLVEFHFRSRAIRLKGRFYCTLCETEFSRNRSLPHVKIFNDSGFIAKKPRGAESDSVDPMQEKNPNEINRKPDVECQRRNDQLDMPVRQLRSSDQRLLTISRARTVPASRVFDHSAVEIWNNLPDDIPKCDI